MDQSYFLDLEYIYGKIFNLFFSDGVGGFKNDAIAAWDTAYFWIRVIGWALSLIFLLLFIHFKRKRDAVVKIEDDKYKVSESSAFDGESPAASKWITILEHLNSTNPNDWKIAILDADSILDDMIKKMGYKGENLGERLKSIERSDFETLDQAWEAHKIRNKIAHASSDFVLTQREANKAIDLYRQVFEEFHYI